MRLARRLISALALLGLLPNGLSSAPPAPHADMLVTVAETTPDRATLWVRGDSATPVQLRYAAADAPRARHDASVAIDAARDRTGRVVLDHLAPATRYDYEVTQDGAEAHGSFVTAPPRAADAPVRVLWSGDLGARNYCRDATDGYAIFRAMAQHHPDFFLFLGDTVYADQECGTNAHLPGADYVASSLAEFHGKHRYNRADPALQAFFRTTSVFAIWDDHEVRNNFSGPTEPLMPIGRQAMVDYWPIEGPADEPQRLYRAVRWGRHLEMFILDTRQYRSDNDAPDGPAKTMLGAAQREWLLHGLAASDATWKVIVTSVPLGIYTGGDSWTAANIFGFVRHAPVGFVHERDLILRFIRDQHLRNVVFIAGDVHHAEFMRHEPWPGVVVHELVAGPIAARQGYPRFLDRSLHSHSLASLGFTPNFAELVADASSLQARVFDAADAMRASVRISAGAEVVRR